MNQASRGPIAAAAAKVKEPARQGLISTTGTFLDTIFICFMTGTVLVMTDSWTGDLAGACMTSYAFSTALAEAGNYIVTVGLIFFAFTTILRNSMEMLYGIPGVKGILTGLVYILIVASGAFLALDVIWIFADMLEYQMF